MGEKNTARIMLGIFLVVGMLVSLFLLYEHFSTTASKFCTFGQSFNCGIVNKSPYANLDGIFYLMTIDYGWNVPLLNISDLNLFLDFITANAFLGFLALLFVFILNAMYKKPKFLWVGREENVKWIRGVLIFGLIYGAYLFYIQHAILQTYCLFCLILDFAMILSLIASYRIKA